MYIDDCKYHINGKPHRRVLIRHGYRQGGKIKKKTIANISQCSDQEIEAIKFALKNKDNLSFLKLLKESKGSYGKSVGAVICLYQISQDLGIKKMLGNSNKSLLILWLVLCRLIDQGSRLSAVRLANIHAGCEILGIDILNEDILYKAMDWLYSHSDEVEKKIFNHWTLTQTNNKTNNLFLYDVSSSYLEGQENELAAWGYNIDKKKGKKQIVYGLLTDEKGESLSVEVFPGNTFRYSDSS